MAKSVYEELLLALQYAAPEGRTLDQLFRQPNRLALVAVSDRGVMEEIGYEMAAIQTRAIAERFWWNEGLVFEAVATESQEYHQVVDRLYALGDAERKALVEMLAEEFPDMPWEYAVVEMTDEMKAAAVRIGREILGNRAPPFGDRPQPRYQRLIHPDDLQSPEKPVV